jgi:hypothetical protein
MDNFEEFMASDVWAATFDQSAVLPDLLDLDPLESIWEPKALPTQWV